MRQSKTDRLLAEKESALLIQIAALQSALNVVQGLRKELATAPRKGTRAKAATKPQEPA